MIPRVTILIHLKLVDEAVVSSNWTLCNRNTVHVRSVELPDAMPVDSCAHVSKPIGHIHSKGVPPAGFDLWSWIFPVERTDAPLKSIWALGDVSHFE